MTSLNAAKLGLRDRGLLQAGHFADVTIFDPEKVIDRSTYTEPFEYNEGIEYVIVNGQVVLDRGKHTGRDAGQGTAEKIEGRHPINKKHAAAVGWTSYQSRPHLPDLVAIDRAC